MPSRQLRRRLVASATALLTAAALGSIGVSAASAATPAAGGQTAFPGSKPAWATPSADQGAAAADTSVEGEIYLPLKNQQGAENLALSVSTPTSNTFRQTLTPAQWIARFSPTQQDYNQLVSYLQSKGLTITPNSTPKSRLFVVFRGTADQVGAAFGTPMHVFAHAGQKLIAPANAPSVPTAIAPLVSGIGLDQARLLTRPDSIPQGDLGSTTPTTKVTPDQTSATPAPDAKANAVTKAVCSTYYGQNTATFPKAYKKTTFPTFICGYTPSQLRSAYGIPASVAGAGQTVAITDAYASPSIVSDVNTYSKGVGEPTLKKGQYTQVVPSPSDFEDQALCTYPSGWQTEQTLDVEAVHGIAPAANILYVGGFNCGGGLDVALSKILDAKLATIVSNSWGDVGEDLPVDVLNGQSHLFLQAAGEGIGLYFSSGDAGDESVNGLSPQPDFPGSSPWVTAVGGTSLGIAKDGSLALETGWGTAGDKVNAAGTGYVDKLPGEFFGGAGGGRSTYFAEPDYQKGVVPDSLAQGDRVSPDLSALADPYTGYLIGLRPIVDDTTLKTGAFVNETYGGTSLASPITATQIALQQQAQGVTVGFANPSIYTIEKTYPAAFRDVLPQNPPAALAYTSARTGNNYLITLDQDSSLKTTAGYDDVTGIGGISFDAIRQVAQGHH